MKRLVLALLCSASWCGSALADGAIFPPSNLYQNNGSVIGTQQTIDVGAVNVVLGSDFLGNLTYWTLTGLTSSAGSTAPDGSSNAVAFTTGTGAAESVASAAAFGNIRAGQFGIYEQVTFGTIPYFYITIENAAGTNIVTEWFDPVNCAPLSNSVTGSGNFYSAFATPIGITNFGFSGCYLGVTGATMRSGNPPTALMIYGVSSTLGSTTWSGASGQTFALWGADAITGLPGNGATGLPNPPPHFPTGSARVSVGPGSVNLGETVTNRVVFVQATQPTLVCSGGSGAGTMTVPSTDALGSFTTSTSNTSCVLTFANSPASWVTSGASPICWATPLTSGVTAYQTPPLSTTSVTFTFSSAITSTQVNYGCGQPLQ